MHLHILACSASTQPLTLDRSTACIGEADMKICMPLDGSASRQDTLTPAMVPQQLYDLPARADDSHRAACPPPSILPPSLAYVRAGGWL